MIRLDLRFALRQVLLKQRAHSTIVVVTLGLAVGLNTLMFSFVNFFALPAPAFRRRGTVMVFPTHPLNLAVLAGADPAGRPLLYTPNPFQGGSSVSHWDTIATPNLLMEPSINADLTHSVVSPQDLTFAMLLDLGW